MLERKDAASEDRLEQEAFREFLDAQDVKSARPQDADVGRMLREYIESHSDLGFAVSAEANPPPLPASAGTDPVRGGRDAELWPAEAGLLRKALDIPPRDNRTERAIAESLSSIPSVKSVAILAKETDEWHLAIIHDDDDIKHALDQIIDKIIEIEDMPSVPLLGTQLIHVSEAEPEDTKGAKVILQR